jgi:hypothetical protein
VCYALGADTWGNLENSQFDYTATVPSDNTFSVLTVGITSLVSAVLPKEVERDTPTTLTFVTTDYDSFDSIYIKIIAASAACTSAVGYNDAIGGPGAGCHGLLTNVVGDNNVGKTTITCGMNSVAAQVCWYGWITADTTNTPAADTLVGKFLPTQTPATVTVASQTGWHYATLDYLVSTVTPTKLTFAITFTNPISTGGSVVLTASETIWSATATTSCVASDSFSEVTNGVSSAVVSGGTTVTITVGTGASAGLTAALHTFVCVGGFVANGEVGVTVTFHVVTSGDSIDLEHQHGYTFVAPVSPTLKIGRAHV